MFHKFEYLTYLTINFGVCLQVLQRKKYLKRSETKTHIFFRREKIWDCAINRLGKDNVTVLEFGVAWGYQTSYWLGRCKNIAKWHGFDTFTGLPESWRHYPKGHFSNSGKPPILNDDRVLWHTGLVQNTFKPSEINYRQNESRLFVSLDLDLFEPTFFVLSKLSEHLRINDLLYFDQPHDLDEGSLLHIFMKLNDSKLNLISQTPCQMLFEIRHNNIVFPNFISKI